MPNIKTYEAPQLGLQPTEVGIDAALQAARRGGAFFNQVGGAVKEVGDEFARNVGSAIRDAGDVAVQYVDAQDRTKVSTAMTGGLATLEQKWQQKLKGNGLDPSDPNYIPPANPNDPTLAAKFQQEEVEPFLEKLRDVPFGENGKKYAENKASELRQHLSQKITADVSTQAAQATVLNRITTVNNLSSLVATDPSFHTVDFALKQSRDDMQTHLASPNLTADQVGKLKIHQVEDEMRIVHAAAASAITKSGNPVATAQEFIAKYPDLIKGDEAVQLAKGAQAQNKANLLTDKQLQQYNKMQEADAAHTELSKTWTDNVTFDENGHATVKPGIFKSIMETEKAHPGAATERAKAMINWAQSEQKEKRETIITDKSAQSALYDGLFSADKPTTDVDILKASAEHKLDAHDTSTLLSLSKALEDKPLKGPIFQGTMASVKGIYGDGEKGHEAYAKFLQTFIPEYLRQERNGTLPPNALDLRDDNSLLSKSLAPYRLSPSEKMRDLIFKRIGAGGDMGGADLTTVLNPDAKHVPSKPLPPLSDRKVGDVVMTPQGLKKWTGTGWVTP